MHSSLLKALASKELSPDYYYEYSMEEPSNYLEDYYEMLPVPQALAQPEMLPEPMALADPESNPGLFDLDMLNVGKEEEDKDELTGEERLFGADLNLGTFSE